MNNEQQAAKESPLSLLEEVKYELAITWNDNDKDIMRLIDSSIYFINFLAGVELDFEHNLIARDMVKKRVFYDHNKALDEFNKNYGDILSGFINNTGFEEWSKSENDN